MVRFKVIRGSRLLLVLSIILLVAVLGLLILRLNGGQPERPASGSASLVSIANETEAKTAVVFASSDSESGALLDPQGDAIDIEILPRSTEAPSSQRVLIYHTHTHEAYEQVLEDPYEALEAWRTTDADHSVVRVGEELAQRLRDYGFEVVHDVTDHEGDQLSTAYSRSVITLMNYTEPFDLYIDLHRDAYVEGTPMNVQNDRGESFAQLMMLIGNGNGFEEKPFYTQNYAFAKALEGRINAIQPGLCKPVLVKDGRYNQHIGVFAILVEVGHNRNTLREAIRSVSPLAQAIFSLMSDDPDPALVKMMDDYRSRRAG